MDPENCFTVTLWALAFVVMWVGGYWTGDDSDGLGVAGSVLAFGASVTALISLCAGIYATFQG